MLRTWTTWHTKYYNNLHRTEDYYDFSSLSCWEMQICHETRVESNRAELSWLRTNGTWKCAADASMRLHGIRCDSMRCDEVAAVNSYTVEVQGGRRGEARGGNEAGRKASRVEPVLPLLSPSHTRLSTINNNYKNNNELWQVAEAKQQKNE